MNINWTKFWTEQLPFCFRKVRILAFITALCSIILRLWNDLVTWGERARQRAACTWQVFWLERLVWLEMGVVIIIEPADGKPFDFVVNVSRITNAETYDEGRMRGLIDKYKLAGKSYRIIDSAISREVKFINHLCEQQQEEFRIQFTDHVCEQELREFVIKFKDHFCHQQYMLETNRLTIEAWHDGMSTGWQYTVRAQKPVASDIVVSISVAGFYYDINIYKGDNQGYISISNGNSKYYIMNITPQKDEIYLYSK